jgi:hypothetical protein
MANYYASARSNYFAVKDEVKFEAWAAQRHLGIWKQNVEVVGGLPYNLFAIYSNEDGGWPSYSVDLETETECGDFDLFDELSDHLADRQIAVLMETGAEKLRYLNAKHLFECKDSTSDTGHSLLVHVAATHSGIVNGNMRFYRGGIAVAINNKNESVIVNLDDIYNRAAETFDVPVENITQCSY